MSYLFSSESVSEGHPDKVADQISDAILDQFLAYDPKARVACESFVTTGQVVLMGEVSSDVYIDLQTIARNTINRIGYTKAEYQFDGNSCGILSAIHEQSQDINRGVDREEEDEQGAGDQGMMFGYATNETESYMPVSLDLAHLIMRTLADIRKEGKEMTYLRPDAKSQVTVQYSDEGIPERIDTIVVSTQHDEFDTDERMLARIKDDVINILIPRVKQQIHSQKVLDLFGLDIKYYVNPTGKFVIGGPHGDTGLTGRKIIVDTYGGKGAHGGGAFSGKDSSKVDRSAAYAARHIAKNMVAAGVSDEMLVQISYAIGVARPMNIYVNTYGRSRVNMTDGEIAKKIEKLFDLRPKAIERSLKLRQPMYLETAAYGHMGRKSEVVKKVFTSHYHETREIDVELFTWEKLDRVDDIKREFWGSVQ
jgi:S-adenosylmethionine synthetase